MDKATLARYFRDEACKNAELFACELHHATGHTYKVRFFTLSDHYVTVRDETMSQDVMGFNGSTWRDVNWSVRNAWSAYYTLRCSIQR